MKKTLTKLLLAASLSMPMILGCEENENNPLPYSPYVPITYTREETNQNKLMDEGVNLTSWWCNDYFYTSMPKLLLQLHDLGLESISILVTQYQSNLNSTDIYPSIYKTPKDCGLELVIEKSKQLGFKTILKPHIDLDDGNWRGNIELNSEEDWQKWFENYNNFITHYAQLAQNTGVDMLIIGTEFEKTVQRNEWNNIIDNVRAIYSGKITYAANWEGYKNVPFWDKLDYIGINSYFSLSNELNPSIETLKANWEYIAQELDAFSELHNKKIMITEVGYQSLDGTSMTPWWRTDDNEVDEQEQADCYSAMLSTLMNRPSIAGIYIWMCYHDPAQDVNGFDFIGKRAEKVVKEKYKPEEK